MQTNLNSLRNQTLGENDKKFDIFTVVEAHWLKVDTVCSKIIRALRIFHAKKLIPNAIL